MRRFSLFSPISELFSPPKDITTKIEDPSPWLSTAFSQAILGTGSAQRDYERYLLTSPHDNSTIPPSEVYLFLQQYHIAPISEIHTCVHLSWRPGEKESDTGQPIFRITHLHTRTPNDPGYICLYPPDNLIRALASRLDTHTPRPACLITTPAASVNAEADRLFYQGLPCTIMDYDDNSSETNHPAHDSQNFSILQVHTVPVPKLDRNKTGELKEWLDTIFHDASVEANHIKNLFLDHAETGEIKRGLAAQSPHNLFNAHFLSYAQGESQRHIASPLAQTSLIHDPDTHTTTLLVSTYALREVSPDDEITRYCDAQGHIHTVGDLSAERSSLSKKIDQILTDWSWFNRQREPLTPTLPASPSYYPSST